jgi:protein disulfide-isomerase
MKKIIFTLFIGVLVSVNSFSQEKLTWHTDVKEAVDIAIKENKQILLFFTGSDWCGWCTKLQNDVFKTSDFEKWSKDLVLVELDFPRGSSQDKKTKNQNNQLKNTFGVRGFPTVHFVNPEKQKNGKVNLKNLGKTGYIPGGVKQWLNVANSIMVN